MPVAKDFTVWQDSRNSLAMAIRCERWSITREAGEDITAGDELLFQRIEKLLNAHAAELFDDKPATEFTEEEGACGGKLLNDETAQQTAKPKAEAEVFKREECTFHYCPNPELCREKCQHDLRA